MQQTNYKLNVEKRLNHIRKNMESAFRIYVERFAEHYFADHPKKESQAFVRRTLKRHRTRKASEPLHKQPPTLR